jgi:hypothetical protein
MLCLSCMRQGYCQRKTINAVTDRELSNPAFVLGCRMVIGRLLPKRVDLLEHFADLYRDATLTVVDAYGREENFDLEILDFPELRHWIDYTFRKPPPVIRAPFIRAETRMRFKTIVSIYRAAHPDAFDRVVAANDNDIPIKPEV